jgi:hypothetical protein
MLRNIRRRHLISTAGGLLVSPSISRAQARNGVALVIGNSKYKSLEAVPNAQKDAVDVASRLAACGIKHELVVDASQGDMQKAIDRFGASARGADFAAFYYAGHGVSFDNLTYLVPLTADPTRNDPQQLVPAIHRMLVFNCCRDSVGPDWRAQSTRWSAFINDTVYDDATPFPNVLTLYSTAPGESANDGTEGRNSPFATSFLRHFETGSVDLKELPGELRRDLLIATQGQQILFDLNTYRQPFRLNVIDPATRPIASNDSSKVVELKNAYNYARQHNILFPPGLVALPTVGGAIHRKMVGSFAYQARSNDGFYPELIVVMTADDIGIASVVMAGRPLTQGYWRFLTGEIRGDKLTLIPNDKSSRYEFEWRGSNEGKVHQTSLDPQGGAIDFSRDFKRLDG